VNTLERLKDKTILFLEDNAELAVNATSLLNIFVQTVHHVTTISEAVLLFEKSHIDIIISDIKLKNENGLDFIRKIRSTNVQIPILIISGHKDEDFLLRSIPLGLTAYLLKPIKYDELIQALERCSEKLGLNQMQKIELKEGWYFDTEKKILTKEGENLSLNKKEALFMELIAHNRDRLITKDMIQSAVWEFEDMSDSALTNFILRLRRRFGKTFIYTIPDLGYRFKL
jgi:two-component system, OmpR family, response regulator VanR